MRRWPDTDVPDIYHHNPKGENYEYWADIFHVESSGRADDHFVEDKEFTWPQWWLNGYVWPWSLSTVVLNPPAQGRGYRWHQAEKWEEGGAGSSTIVDSNTKNPLTMESVWINKPLNIFKQEYKYAKSVYPKYELPNNENPLSISYKYESAPSELIFSKFRHYVSPTPLGFQDVKYEVTDNEPIKRKSSGGQYESLQKISTWSPYSDAVWIDFANANAYDKSIEKSSIWG